MGSTSESNRQRYEQLVEVMKCRYAIRVRRWRRRMSGCAWEMHDRHGNTVARWIESPRPRTPISAAIFLHEVGHHAIGFRTYKPRCLEEYMAWQWALRAMSEHQIPIDGKVARRVESSLRYAVAKARRRNIKSLPQELVKYAS
jgi:hypothetical protein